MSTAPEYSLTRARGETFKRLPLAKSLTDYEQGTTALRAAMLADYRSGVRTGFAPALLDTLREATAAAEWTERGEAAYLARCRERAVASLYGPLWETATVDTFTPAL